MVKIVLFFLISFNCFGFIRIDFQSVELPDLKDYAKKKTCEFYEKVECVKTPKGFNWHYYELKDGRIVVNDFKKKAYEIEKEAEQAALENKKAEEANESALLKEMLEKYKQERAL